MLSEDILQQFRSAVSDFRVFTEVARDSYEHAEPHNAVRFVEEIPLLLKEPESNKCPEQQAHRTEDRRKRCKELRHRQVELVTS